jgi:hypothetical protein
VPIAPCTSSVTNSLSIAMGSTLPAVSIAPLSGGIDLRRSAAVREVALPEPAQR